MQAIKILHVLCKLCAASNMPLANPQFKPAEIMAIHEALFRFKSGSGNINIRGKLFPIDMTENRLRRSTVFGYTFIEQVCAHVLWM